MVPKHRLHAAILGSLFLLGMAAGARADVITYDLVDTPHGRYLPGGFYKNVGGDPRFETYSFEEPGARARLVYDEDRGIVRVHGRTYNRVTEEFSNFNLSYNSVERDGDKLTLQNMNTVGFFGNTDTNGKGFTLTLGDTITGHGWLTDPTTGRHFGDFHFAGVRSAETGSIPAPAPLGLLAVAALFGLRRHLRRG